MTNPLLEVLTPREREILSHIAQGDSLPEIAQKLRRSLKTIESHRLSIGRKLKASNRVELARIAISQGLVAVNSQTVDQTPERSDLAERELGWMQQINQAVCNTTASTFIHRFCDAASLLPGIRIAAICTPDPYRNEGPDVYHRFTIATSEHGKTGEPRRHHAMNTPCEEIIATGGCCYGDGVTEAYPKDAWLRQIQAKGYIGLQLRGRSGGIVGAVVMISSEPLENVDAYQRIMSFFAPHVARALDDCLELDALRSQCDHLEAKRSAIEKNLNSPGELNAEEVSALVIARISEQMHPLAGPAFLRGIVGAICEEFGFKFATIARLDQAYASRKLKSITFRANGSQADPICYDPEGTPCSIVLEEGICSVGQRVAEAFPKATILAEKQVESFVGVRLPTPGGDIAGVLWVTDTRPLKDTSAAERVLRHFAPRVGAELANFVQYEVLMQEREWMEAELGGNSDVHTLPT
jgi:DNA-binding CsgD family transcriptional regulator